MKTNWKVNLTLLFVLIVQITFAQTKTITGVVTEARTGEPLPGVNIIIKGTNNGTTTDFDGKYKINAQKGQTLVFSYLGYETVEKKVGDNNVINVQMKEKGQSLDKVIVVGYSKTKKQAFTGTAKVIKPELIKTKNVSNVSTALAGEASGVTVINPSGQPGTTATIRIRGFGSVNGNRSPLYVVDGVPFDGDINSINTADIKSVTILKDATATAIYGSRGANGVILIQTKNGYKDSSFIQVDLKTGTNFSFIPRYEMIQSPDLYMETAWNAQKNTGDYLGVPDPVAYANNNLFGGTSSIAIQYNFYKNVTSGADLIDPNTGKIKPGIEKKYVPENWADYAFDTAIRNEVNLTMGGGTDKTRYYTSVGYLDDNGYILNSNFNRISTRLKLEFTPVKRVNAGANIGYAYSKKTHNGQSQDSGSIFWFVDNIPSIYPLFLRDSNGNKVPDPYYGGYQYDYGIGRGFGAFTNAIGDAKYNLDQDKRHSLNGNIFLNINILENLVLENKYGAQYYSLTTNDIRNPFYGSAVSNGGSLFKGNFLMFSQNLLNLLRYKFDVNEKHHFNVLAAHEANEWKRERSYISKSKVVNILHGLDQPTNYVNTSSPASGYLEEVALESYFGQVNYNFDEKYYFSGTLRRDGSSRFYKNKWGTFGSAGFSWIVSKEDFLKDFDKINYLKAKISYGVLGDEAGVGFYSGVNGYDIGNLNGNISLTTRPIANPDLTWETSKMFQTGLEFGVLKNKIEGTIDYYVKNTTNLIFDRRIAISSGDALIRVNDGALQNRGLEFDLTSHIIQNKKLKFDFTINGEFLHNELTRMPIDPSTNQEKLIDVAGLYGRAKGHSLYDFYVKEWAGVDDANGDPLWYLYYDDINNNGSYDSGEEIQSLFDYKLQNPNAHIKSEKTNQYSLATQKFVGKSVVPKVRGAFRFKLGYGQFDFGAQFLYSLGGYSYDSAYANAMSNDQIGNSNYHVDILKAWTKPGDNTDVPRHYSNQNINVNSASSRFITKSDYLLLNNVRLGYKLPKNFIKSVKSANVWLSGDNLFLLSARKGFNPTTSETGGSSQYRYSPLTTINLGLNVKL